MGLHENEPTQFDLQQELYLEAGRALGAPTFDARSAIMAGTVADEAALLAARSLGMLTALPAIHQLFLGVCDKVNSLFQPAFTWNGKPITDNESLYNAAISNASQPAYAALDRCFNVLSLQITAMEVFENATFADALALAKKITNDQMPPGYKRYDVKLSLHETAKNDYFEHHVDNLHLLKLL